MYNGNVYAAPSVGIGRLDGPSLAAGHVGRMYSRGARIERGLMASRLSGWYLLLPLLGAALVFGAFGPFGQGDDGSGDVGERLSEMVLTQEDLPEGYLQDEPMFFTNEELALGDQEKLAKLEEQGRILGYNVSFIRGDVSASEAPYFGVESAASLYEAEGGASGSFGEAVEEARATDWEAQLGFGETELEEIDRSIADETLWIRVTGVVELGEEQTLVLVIDDQILMRQGSARGFLRVSSAMEGSSDRSAFIEEIEALARRQASRMGGGEDDSSTTLIVVVIAGVAVALAVAGIGAVRWRRRRTASRP